MQFANVIPAAKIPSSSDNVFSYGVPQELQDKLAAGMIVDIPLRRKIVMGVVESVTTEKPAFPVRPIAKLAWPEPIVTPQLMELARFIAAQYVVSLGLVIKAIITKPAPRAVLLPALPAASNQAPGQLTPAQQAALAAITGSLGAARTFLLHGVTGSGKTEVYLQAARQALADGRQVLILVPEIALTPQTLERFAGRFQASRVAVVHSRLSYGQKFVIWKKTLAGELDVVIGPRSALFAPFRNLGLIAMDEEHESSYKQFEQNPKFHARTVAEKLSQLWRCPLVLGDATPSVETYWASEQGLITRLELPERIFQKMPPVELVDMREETRRGNFSIFSEPLLKAMAATLSKKQQIILFLNRRGTATSLQCQDCGNLVMCARCSVPLVYHRDKSDLECHHCGRTYEIPAKCPACGGTRLRFLGTGTEKVESQVRDLFPQARIRRLDRDTVKHAHDIDALYADFTGGRLDILVGTQLLAKGWDVAGVGLIGVMNADTILSLPDFRSNERTFQLATQVAGRTGRGAFPGSVVLQTYTPENFAIQAAVKHDYAAFYRREIADRQEFNYPPFVTLVKISVKHAHQEKVMQMAQELVNRLGAAQLPAGTIIGPAASFIARQRGRYAAYVILKLPHTSTTPLPPTVVKTLTNLHPGWDIDVDPDTLL